jgi:hypothetical protein
LAAGKTAKGVFMKQKQTWAVIFAALAFGTLVLTGCSNPLSNRPPTEEDSPDIPAGFGTLRVSLTQGAARTVMPAPVLSDLYLKYWFVKDSGSPEEKSPDGGIFTLVPGTYTLWVEAFVDPAKTELAADGSSASFVVTPGTNVGTVNVALRPIVSEGAGSLAFSLTYPAGGTVEYLTLTRIAGAETIDLTAGITPSGGDPLVFSGEKTGITSGYYWLNVRIRDGAGRYAGKSEATHIYQNLTAQAVYVFSAEDFSLHTVTFSVGAGGGTAPASIALNGEADITLPGSSGMIAPANKIFIGWSDGTALYWEGDPYTASDSVTLTAQWELTAISEVEAYLDHTAGGGKANPVSLPVNLALGSGGWDALLFALNTAGEYVALDISDSTITGMSGTAGEFDPGTTNTGEKYIVSLALPSTATSIKAGTQDNFFSEPTFKNFTSLTSVSGIGVTAVGEYAFNHCASLAELSLPAATSIGDFAFYYCTSLAELSLPAVVSIGNTAFVGCTSLIEVSLPVVTSIGFFAFSHCTSLSELSLPVVTSIGNGAFDDCRSLTTVSLPASLTTIGSNPFAYCRNLTTITVDPGNTAFKTQGGMLLNKAGTTLLAYPTASGMVALDSVTAIGSYAFYGCRSLTEVNLPAAVSIGEFAFVECMSLTGVNLPAATSIGNHAFYDCTSLAEISLPATPPTVGINIFTGINTAQTVTVKVLAASISAYDTTWQTKFKGGDTNITLVLQAQYDDVAANIILWANEDGSILGSPQDMRISKTASGNPDNFTVTVAGVYTLVQWQVNGIPLGSLGNPLTIAAADYAVGKTYILGVQVTKDGVPYSTDIRFTVDA